MPSPQARQRALERGPGALGFLLAHHWPGQLDRCYRFWCRGRPVWVCARCAGLYPVLAAVLAGLLYWRPPTGWADWPWLFGLPLPALVDWGWSRWSGWTGRNWLRSLTGAMLGVGLARGLQLHIISPGHRLALAQFVFMGAVVLAVEIADRYRRRGGGAG